MKNLGADLEKKIINYNNNPILKWCLTNTAIDIDKNNNIQPIKTSNSRRRIDGLASLLNAYVQLERVYDNYMSVIQKEGEESQDFLIIHSRNYLQIKINQYKQDLK